MLMNINTISYWIAEAVSGIMKNQKIFLSGIAIMFLALFIVAIFFVAVVLGDSLMATIEDAQGTIQVYLKDLTDEQIKNISDTIVLMDGVEKIDYTSQEDARKKAEESLPPGMADGVPDHVFPATLTVTVNDLEKAEQIALNIRGIEGVGEEDSDVTFNEDAKFIGKVVLTIKVVASTILILAIVGACFIMTNSIKLMLHSRRKEISIMKYVGATDLFTKAPFVIEGLLIALVSALFVIILSGLLCDVLTDVAFKIPMFNFLEISEETRGTLTTIILVVAIGVGTIGSSISINKYLDV